MQFDVDIEKVLLITLINSPNAIILHYTSHNNLKYY